ncbi:sigma-70 family RNA polymerase sigma factor [uncultured Microscilla sp.]|uniref:sigma-70 family RNA polymerase sigma factor n=1 Tax=uncultured Microscilla sp. TaxID=432653 RepID=UPI00262E2849|nr:sigma-70 family RNA polymerase sigma factor [uncultured Microscilla sp.]
MEIKCHTEASDIWAEYKEGLRNYILKKVKDSDTANELSHEVLMKVYSACCSGNQIRNVRSWLYQIAHNTSIDYLRKQQKTSAPLPELADHPEDNTYQEAIELVTPLLMLLPPKYALPLKLADIDGAKQATIAQQLGLSLTATKSRIQRARKLLKELIMECCHIETDHQGNLMAFGVKNTCAPLQAYLKGKKDITCGNSSKHNHC